MHVLGRDEWPQTGSIQTQHAGLFLLVADLIALDLPGLIETADRTFAAWHGHEHAGPREGTHPARQRTVFTSRERILAGDWTMHRTPSLPPGIRDEPTCSPRPIDYDLPALFVMSGATRSPAPRISASLAQSKPALAVSNGGWTIDRAQNDAVMDACLILRSESRAFHTPSARSCYKPQIRIIQAGGNNMLTHLASGSIQIQRVLRSTAVAASATAAFLLIPCAANAALTFKLSSVTVEGSPIEVAAGEFNEDGHLDLATANLFSEKFKGLSVLIGKGNGTFEPTSYESGLGFTESVVTGDFTGKGHTDALILSHGFGPPGEISVYPGNGKGGFGARTSMSTTEELSDATAGDFNEDGKLDIVATDFANNTIKFYPGKGTGAFGTPKSYAISSATSGALHVASGDLNSNGELDVVATNKTKGTVSALLGNGEGGFGTPAVYSVGKEPTFVAVGDLNGDGKPDIVVANEGSNTVSVLLGKGNGEFEKPVEYAAEGKKPEGVAIGDFNADGKMDIAVANSESNTVSVLQGKGNGTFEAAKTYKAGEVPTGVVAADLNGDGNTDIAVADNTGKAVGILLNTSLPTIEATPTSLSFPETKVGEDSAAKTVTIKNGGSALLKIKGMPIAGAEADEFVKSSDTCTGSVLKVGATCTVSIRFEPKVKGTAEVTLGSESNATTQISVKMSGKGT